VQLKRAGYLRYVPCGVGLGAWVSAGVGITGAGWAGNSGDWKGINCCGASAPFGSAAMCEVREEVIISPLAAVVSCWIS
jgi:hypothetical protein